MAVDSKRCWWLVTLTVASLLTLSLLACAPAPKAEPKDAQPAKAPIAAEAKAPAPSAAQPAAPAAKPAAAVAPAGKRELVVIQGTDMQKFDPAMTAHETDNAATFNLFDNLVDRDSDNKLVPGLATEWKTVNDTTWQFKLRKGIKFHNGDPFSAEDVKFSLDRITQKSPTYNPKVAVASYWPFLERTEVVDESTVNVITRVPDPLLPGRLTSYGGQIIPKGYVQKAGDDGFNQKPIGTGPLKFVEWVKDDRAVFEVNKDWWGGKLDFDRVVFKPMPEPAPRVAALLKGEADIINRLPPDDVDRVNKSANAMVVGAPFAGLYAIATLYNRPGPISNKYFHQALSLAIDRQAIVRDLWRGQGVAPNGVYPKGNFAYDPKMPVMEYNPAKAKEMLQKAGYKGEETIFESTMGYMANDRQMAEALVAMFRDAGINAKLEIIEFSVRAEKGRDLSFKNLFWTTPNDILLEPDGMIYRNMGTGGKHRFNGVALWADGTWDKLMQQALATMDDAKRFELYSQAHQIWLDWMPWIPVIQPFESFGIQRYIDWKPMGNQDFRIQDVKFKR